MSARLEQLDNARSQFVSNASHELKTPLSTMKILIETLLYQQTPDPAMEKEFLGDINKEIDRLNGIVSRPADAGEHRQRGHEAEAVSRCGWADLVQEQARRLIAPGPGKRHRD